MPAATRPRRGMPSTMRGPPDGEKVSPTAPAGSTHQQAAPTYQSGQFQCWASDNGQQTAAGAARFVRGDGISLAGTVSIVHEEEYGRRRVTVRLEGYDYPIAVSDAYVDLVAKAEPVKPSKRRQPLFGEAD